MFRSFFDCFQVAGRANDLVPGPAGFRALSTAAVVSIFLCGPMWSMKLSAGVRNGVAGYATGNSWIDSLDPTPVAHIQRWGPVFIGMENGILVNLNGHSGEGVEVTANGTALRKGSNPDLYLFRPDSLGIIEIAVHIPGRLKVVQKYEVILLPIIAKLGAKHTSKEMVSGEFRAQGGIQAAVERYEKRLYCEIIGFEVLHYARGGQMTALPNKGPRWDAAVSDQIQAARPGDLYLFRDIKCLCSDWPASRDLEPLIFTIK